MDLAGLLIVASQQRSSVASMRRQAAAAWANLPREVMELAQTFRDSGYEFALVGGPVRDSFLGREATDLDFTTSARPDDVEQILNAWGDTTWSIGKEYGTIGAERGGLVVEVTTYRSDQYDPTSRKPDVMFGDSIEGDLGRRDFTINAMAVRLPDLVFVDPFNGLDDLSAGVIRTPGTPEASFSDDPLRMMRAARFAAQLGFAPAPEVLSAIESMSERIEIVAAERVQVEFSKLMTAQYPRVGIEILVNTGLMDRILPEVSALRLEIDEHHRHKDVYEHSLTVLDQAIDLETDDDGPVPRPDLVLRIAALLHDIGKPATRRFESGGGVSFHHHEVVGAKMAAKRLRAMRFDKETIHDVARLIELHLRFHGYGEQAWTDSAVRRYVTDAGPLLERLHRLTRSDCTTRNQKKAERLSFAYDDLENRIAELLEKEELAAVRPDLDGTEIMEILGIPPGPQVGQAYKYMLDLRLDQGPMSPEDAREALLQWWNNR